MSSNKFISHVEPYSLEVSFIYLNCPLFGLIAFSIVFQPSRSQPVNVDSPLLYFFQIKMGYSFVDDPHTQREDLPKIDPTAILLSIGALNLVLALVYCRNRTL